MARASLRASVTIEVEEADKREMDPARAARYEARRAAIVKLADATRLLSDAVVSTGREPVEIDAAAARVREIAEQLAEVQHDGPYSGLLPRVRDYTRPESAMPLSAICGEASPIRPDITLRLDGERVTGRAKLGKKHIGPVHHAHGGVTALICDQIVALAARAARFRALTHTLSVRYVKPVPLYRELEIAGWCEPRSERRAAGFATISCEGVTLISAEAILALAPDWSRPEQRVAAPRVELEKN
jgi:acyl-coenzyme A thioesterase PaaI-like protein